MIALHRFVAMIGCENTNSRHRLGIKQKKKRKMLNAKHIFLYFNRRYYLTSEHTLTHAIPHSSTYIYIHTYIYVCTFDKTGLL